MVVPADAEVELATFPDLGLDRRMDDRALWTFCQEGGWALFTENRNHDGPDSLQAVLTDSWSGGHLPVLTLSNKGRFEHDRGYAERVVRDLAELLFGMKTDGLDRDRQRINVPVQNT